MRTMLTLSFLLFILSSCSKYQYLTLSSDNTPRDQHNQFIVDNDSFRVEMGFYGFNGPLQVKITNKLAGLLEVDWSRSFLIRNERPVPLFNPTGTINGELQRDRVTSGGNTLINASYTQPSAVQRIPTGSSITKESFGVAGGYKLMKLDRGKMKKEKVMILGFKKKTWALNIPKEVTPLSFRVYLTLSAGQGEPPVVIDRSFYVSRVVSTKGEPQYMPTHLQGNVIVLEGSTAGGAVLTTLGGLALLGGAIAVAAATE